MQTMNSENLPDDANGDALRRVFSDGSDPSQPMDIDFHIAVPDAQACELVAAAAKEHGYDTKVVEDEEDGSWTCWCTIRMLATYEGIAESEDLLGTLSQPHGGYLDGWGTYGNAEDV